MKKIKERVCKTRLKKVMQGKKSQDAKINQKFLCF